LLSALTYGDYGAAVLVFRSVAPFPTSIALYLFPAAQQISFVWTHLWKRLLIFVKRADNQAQLPGHLSELFRAYAKIRPIKEYFQQSSTE